MYKYVCIFACLLGVSLGSVLSGLSSSKKAELLELLEAVKEHREYFDMCEDVLGEKVKSCGALPDDLVTMESDVTTAVSELDNDYQKGVKLMAQFTTCGTESILKQITCYEKVMTSAKALMATVEANIVDIQQNLMTDVSAIERDVKSCVVSGYTSQLLNTKIALCKLNLMHKN